MNLQIMIKTNPSTDETKGGFTGTLESVEIQKHGITSVGSNYRELSVYGKTINEVVAGLMKAYLTLYVEDK